MNLNSVKDLVVKHSILGANQMLISLKNGWGLSILSGGYGIHSDGESTFEVALLDQKGDVSYCLHYDVWGHVTKGEIYEIIRKAAAL
jgi:hypothetical protein